MTNQELNNLKNGTSIVITYPSGRFEVTLHESNNFFNGGYYHKGERINIKNIRIATEEDVFYFIYRKQKQLDQLERELMGGI